jgi:hypothetical protein
VTRPEGAKTPLPQRSFPTENREEQKSLVNKLIGRIRTL